MAAELVTITVPAKGEYARTVRMVASELAVRLGMPYDHVEDVRMAADEAFVYACGRSGPSKTVAFQFELTDDAISMCVGPFVAADDVEAPLADVPGHYASFILEAVCDTFIVESGEDGARLRIVKHRSDEE